MTSQPIRAMIALAVLVILVVLIVQRYRSGREGEVVFDAGIQRVPIPLGERVVINRGEVFAGAGSGAWETVAFRSAAHLTITNVSVFGERHRQMEFYVALAELPFALPVRSTHGQRQMMMLTGGWLRLEAAK